MERLATLRRAFGSVADQFPLVDIRATAALCQTAVKLCETSKVALIVVNHVRKSVGRDDIGSAQAAVELRFQFATPRSSRVQGARRARQPDRLQSVCASRSWIAPIVPNAPRNRPSPNPAAKGIIAQADGQYRLPL